MSSTGQHSDQYWFIFHPRNHLTQSPLQRHIFIHKEAPELTTQALPLKPLGYLNICLNFAMSYEYTRGHYAGEAHQSGPRVVREAGVNPAQYPLL